MHTYRVWFDDGSATIVNARTPEEANQIAEAMYPGTHSLKAERLD